MLQVSFKVKMFLISLLPMIALLYLSIHYMSDRYKDAQKSATLMLSAQITQATSNLIHNLQIERGLSSGYLASKTKKPYEKKLLKQRILTDNSFKVFFKYITLKTNQTERINTLSFGQYKRNIRIGLEKLHQFEEVRSLILNSSISFLEEVYFFRDANANLVSIIKTLTTFYKNEKINPLDIYSLELLKENAGKERAYVYNQILSDKTSSLEIEKIRELILEQARLKSEFFKAASQEDLTLYKRMIHSNLEYTIKELRQELFATNFDKQHASTWFKTSTDRINELNNLSKKFIDAYLLEMINMNHEARQSLITTFLLWILSFFSFAFLTFIINKLINKQTKHVEDLQIASYTFDSHEAIVITNSNGLIIKINKAFSNITGYTEEEVLGKSTNILKSYEHPDSFYKELWENLLNKGFWSGEIKNKRKNGEIYPEKLSITAIRDSNGVVTNYIAQFLDISSLKKAQEQALYQASHDFLTALPNRKSMLKKLQEENSRASRHNFLNAFLFIDLDGFKQVNDTFGHIIGDQLLIEVGERLQSAVREEDYVSRISGDEFSVMLLDLHKNEAKAVHDTNYITEKILTALSKPFFLDKHTVSISASIGVKIFPDSNKDTNQIIQDADTVMYTAKENGKNKFVFFSKEIEKRQTEKFHLEEEIKQAFEKEEFVFHLQAKVDVISNKITGAELLVRWQHPSRGILSPYHFLDVVKEMNVSHKFTFMALENACKFIQVNQNIFRGTLSININSYELSSQHSINQIKEIITSHKIDASYIELEILEDDLIKDFDIIIKNINELQELGITFSMDDFETGYSSIGYLQKLPVQTLKIDRTFMHNLELNNNRELVKTVVDMANLFELKTVIEGVETKEQLDFIKELGASQYQGFYFSQAVNEGEFLTLLSKE